MPYQIMVLEYLLKRNEKHVFNQINGRATQSEPHFQDQIADPHRKSTKISSKMGYVSLNMNVTISWLPRCPLLGEIKMVQNSKV